MASKELLGLRVAVYARFSSEGQREASIEDQLRRCHEFVVANGGTVRDELTFSDRAASGAGTDRPGYERMMRLVANEDLSRLSRAAADLFTVQRLFEFLEVRLIGIRGRDRHVRQAFNAHVRAEEPGVDDLHQRPS